MRFCIGSLVLPPEDVLAVKCNCEFYQEEQQAPHEMHGSLVSFPLLPELMVETTATFSQ